MVWNAPSKSTTSSVHSRRSTSTCSAWRRPRSWKSTPSDVVLDLVPARADAEVEAVARQHGQLGRLLGDERGLALGEDQHRRRHLQRLGDGGDEGEERERLVERDVLVVGALEAAGAVGVGAEHVVVHEEVVDALRPRGPGRRP